MTKGATDTIPVSIVTGFLGSGKTTLISRILRSPSLARTAVIVNEFGEIGLDHDLVASSDDLLITLSTGCLCCAVQTDLALTLAQLLQRRNDGTADYDRVLIETSGLSDPAPMLQTLMTDTVILATHRIAAVVTVVDCVLGEQTLGEHSEARQQVALADRLLISKTDLLAPSAHLLHQLDLLNCTAPRLATSQLDPAMLFEAASVMALSERIAAIPRSFGHGDIATFVVIRETPLPALVLTLLLQAIAEHCGDRVLRMKGLVAIDEMCGRPAVIHGVRHVVSAPVFLDRWPSADERTRIVFIARRMPRYFVSRLLDAIDIEVREEISHAAPVAAPAE